VSTDEDARRAEVAKRVAREAGQLALQHLGDPIYFKIKGHRDLMVGAAQVVQDRIRDLLLAEFPDDAFMGEEGPDDEALPIAAERLWVVDPIDGSINYFLGLPIFCISIAYREAAVFRLGVVYDPNRDEMFSATFSGGSELNGQPIAIDREGEGEDIYEQSLVSTDFPGDGLLRTRTMLGAGQLAGRFMGMLSLGSPALTLCYIAAGRIHGYFHLQLHVWDVAAAGVILREAGGVLTNLSGGSWLHTDGAYVASNGAVHGEMLRLLKVTLPRAGADPN
jgi:myo-inositol-1(or 4)-monophosphatase